MDRQGYSSMHFAAATGSDEMIKLLLLKEADVNCTNIYGWTPLMLAARYGHISAMSLLLKNGAEVNVFNKLGLSVLSSAVYSGNLLAVKILVESGANVYWLSTMDCPYFEYELNSLMVACSLGYFNIVQYLLQQKAPFHETTTMTGWSPLMFAASNGHSDIVQMLIDFGADANLLDKLGRSALELATIQNHQEVRNLLKDVTSKPNPSSTELFFECVKEKEQLLGSKRHDSTRKISNKKNPAQLKGWFDGVTSHLQSILSPAMKETKWNTLPTIQISGPSSSTVEEEDDCFYAGQYNVQKGLTSKALKSPEHIYGSELRRFSMDPITPPMLEIIPDEKMHQRRFSFEAHFAEELEKLHKKDEKKKISYKSKKSNPSKSMSGGAVGDSISKQLESFKSSKSKRSDFNSFSQSSPQPKFLKKSTQNLPTNRCPAFSESGGLSQLLQEISLEKHIQTFKDQEVDLEAFKELTKKDLEEIGINSMTSSEKLLQIVKQLKNTK